MRVNQIVKKSILDNLKIVREDISDKKIIDVCKQVKIHEHIMTLTDKYDTIMGQRGTKFSGGQLQRLALARSLLCDGDIILLDEVTSGIDGMCESYLAEMYYELSADKTIIIIAHKLSTIMKIPRILVIDKGKIVAEGNHEKLIEECENYQKLFLNEWNQYKKLLNSKEEPCYE